MSVGRWDSAQAGVGHSRNPRVPFNPGLASSYATAGALFHCSLVELVEKEPLGVWVPFSQLEQQRRLVPKWDNARGHVAAAAGFALVWLRLRWEWHWGGAPWAGTVLTAQFCPDLVGVGAPEPKDTWAVLTCLHRGPRAGGSCTQGKWKR